MTEIRARLLKAQKTWFNEIMRETNADEAVKAITDYLEGRLLEDHECEVQ